jgi:hypothetical protein
MGQVLRGRRGKVLVSTEKPDAIHQITRNGTKEFLVGVISCAFVDRLSYLTNGDSLFQQRPRLAELPESTSSRYL